MSFNITLVRSRLKNKPYAKKDGVYSGPTWSNNIGLQTISDTPKEVFNTLQTLSGKPDTCMVMGTAVRPEIIDTDRTMQNFVEEPIRMVVFDLDNYESKSMIAHGKNVTYPQLVGDAKGFIHDHLPPEFQDTTFIMRFSSSFMVKKGPMLRSHIIFILEEAQYPREIGMWMKQEKIPADATFYLNLTQPVFTAAPMWDSLVDPLRLTNPPIPRVGIATGGNHLVRKGWQPYVFERREKINVDDLPTASQLPGKMGSFCRMNPIKKILQYLGYTEEEEDRFLAPESTSGLPGAMVFENGFVYSHHDNDPINRVAEEVFHFKRRSLNSYDLMHGWSQLHKEDVEILKEFEFLLDQAVINDSSYQDEVTQGLISRTDWLESDIGYEGINRKIIDGLIIDMNNMGLTSVTREYIFNTIKGGTKKVTLGDLKNLWKNVRKDNALQREDYDPEANLRHMANIFKRQKVIYSHHKTSTGDFWCYFGASRVWKRCNHTQARAFIYNHIHSSIPIKVEIDFTKMEHLTTMILRETCLSMSNFKRGAGWAFKYGKYGIDMKGLFIDSDWSVDNCIKTLAKEDHICKELPITYREWKESNDYPKEFVDFLVSSCEEDIESVELLREYGGYIMADSYFLHKMLILEGVPGSGKSILAKIYQEMLGYQYCAAVSITGMTGQFGLGELPGKKLAVMSEARQVDTKSLRALVPILLKVIGQDYIDTEAKHKNAISELLECKILMMTNRTPVIPDDTGALSQRLLMVRLNKCFRGTKHEILGLDSIILERGLAGIIKWHLKGLENLSNRKLFIEPESGRMAKEWLMEQIDPLKTFIDNYFKINMDADHKTFILQVDFIRYFRAFLRRLGQPTDDTNERVRKRASIRNIRSLYPATELGRRFEGAKRMYFIRGFIPQQTLDIEFVAELSELE